MAKKPLPPLRVRLAVCAAGLAVAACAWAVRPWLQEQGSVMVEAKTAGCLPWQVYWYDKKQTYRPLRRNDVILFPARGMAPVIPDGLPVGKLVAGLPGDKVEIRNGNVYINGSLIADVRYGAGKLGKPVDYWDTAYRLEDDEIFVFGTEKHSWDSRYWGPHRASMVRGRLLPLF